MSYGAARRRAMARADSPSPRNSQMLFTCPPFNICAVPHSVMILGR